MKDLLMWVMSDAVKTSVVSWVVKIHFSTVESGLNCNKSIIAQLLFAKDPNLRDVDAAPTKLRRHKILPGLPCTTSKITGGTY